MNIPAKQATPAIAELRAVSKSYNTAGGHELKVLDNIDLAVHEGELLALLGQSGSGKSTILRCMTGLIEPSSGRVLSNEKPLHGVNPSASIVFQTFALYPWLTVEQNVAVGLMSRQVSRTERDAAVDRAIDLIGLGNYHAAYPRELSGGMRQRVGLARALVSKPKLLCLDEAFSALDVLTAENLRQELISLWRSPDSGLTSIFMVTHNIEEAVEMATRIVVVFPSPGRLGLVLENPLPYPRDTKSAEFQRLVSIIHDSITTLTLPDLPPEVPVPGEPISRGRKRMESIPLVPVGEILGLMRLLHDSPELTNIYDISDEIGKEFGETISVVKAAEILELVDTPKQDVCFTELGRRFMAADRIGRRTIFAEQVYKLRIFHIILALLNESEEIEADRLIRDIASALPYDNPEKTFETMIAWGRYAGLMDFNAKTRMVFVPKEGEALENLQA
ncbi:MAG TPA: nitrate/sulfonate/bicarbonate ABC transporter ATP-binding protein [Burkholderiaceae bacterium]|jgi:NitT/TauT family transport system ATP-binding protein